MKSHDAYQSAHTALGMAPDLMVFAPRRLAFLKASSTSEPIEQLLPVDNIASSAAAPGNLGGGTNEDWTWLINRASTPLATSPPMVEAHAQGTGVNLTANFVIHGYAAFATARRPEGLAVVKGTTTPTF